ncbi:hypothetical protein [Streptomyces sp. NPDC002619]|uniref:hypothetical protein n=1 Tax=Streptomyces sp. NPDC002619 TaxID=3364655 RepID=UPI003688CC37
MTESWTLDGDGVAVAAADAVELLRRRIAEVRLETWLKSSAGRSLAVVSNTERALVMLLDGDGDSAGHAVDPAARGTSGGFVLGNGQCDAYADRDTVPLAEALRIVRYVLGTGAPPADVVWAADG